MEHAVLTHTTDAGEKLEAVFCPAKGMNLMSFRKDGVEVIDQSTKDLFEERCAGLGAMIGPHFHRRNSGVIPPVADESKFPHIAKVKAKGVEEPFSHGIGRYAPWEALVTPTAIKGQLTSQMEWNGVTLKELQGQDFKLWFNAELRSDGLHLNMRVASDYDSLVGIHYYYRVPEGQARVMSDSVDYYLDQGEKKAIPSDWNYSDRGQLIYDLSSQADYTFHPRSRQASGTVRLETSEYTLNTHYKAPSAEVCWQLWRPDTSYVCIEPMSAANPRKPVLSVSGIEIHLQIV